MGRLLTSRLLTGATPRETAQAAARSWIATEIPKYTARLDAWAAKIPASPTVTQAEALRSEFAGIKYAFLQSAKLYVETPYAAWWSDLDSPYAAIAQAEAPYLVPYNALAGAMPGYRTPEQTIADRQYDTDAAAAWAAWAQESAPILARLMRITTDAKASTDPLVLSDAATEARDEGLRVAHRLLDRFTSTSSKTKNLSAALASIEMAWQEAAHAIASELRVRGLLDDARRRGYVVSGDGSVYLPGDSPDSASGSGFRFSSILAILGVGAAILLIRRARS